MDNTNDQEGFQNNSTETTPTVLLLDESSRCEYCQLLDDLLLMAVASEEFIGLSSARRSDITYLTLQLKKSLTQPKSMSWKQ